MRKFMKKRLNQKGLTLIELLAVIVILAIIAAIAIPAIGNIINKQRDKAMLSDASSIISAAKIAYADGACEDATNPNICDSTELSPYLDKNLENPGNASAQITDGKWSVKWKTPKAFKHFKTTGEGATNTELHPLVTGDDYVDEEDILDAMNK